MTSRRWFLRTVSVSLLGAPFAAQAQPGGRVYRIAFLHVRPFSAANQESFYEPFFERFKDLGWIRGRDFVTQDGAYGDRMDRVPGLATDLIKAGVDVFVVTGASDAARVQQVTSTIPIVAWGAGDLVEAGVVDSVSRPGRNVTGIQTLQPELVSKHLSLLKEVVPRFSRSGFLFQTSPSSLVKGSNAAVSREAEAGAKALGIALHAITIQQPGELANAFSAFKTQHAQAVVIVRSQFMGAHVKTLVDLALKHRLPIISDMNNLAAQGGLMSYGFDFRETLRSAAAIVDKILRGAKVSEIPIQQATAFRFVVNLATAKALGLSISPSVLARADQDIE